MGCDVSSAEVDGPADLRPLLVLSRGIPHHADDHVDRVAAQHEMRGRLRVVGEVEEDGATLAGSIGSVPEDWRSGSDRLLQRRRPSVRP